MLRPIASTVSQGGERPNSYNLRNPMMRLLFILLVLVSTSAAHADDGWVFFNNFTTSKISTNSSLSGSATGLMTGPVGSFYFGLFVAPLSVLTSSGPNDPKWAFTENYGTNSTLAGRFTCGIYTNIGYNGAVSIPGYPAGSQANLLVRGWSADWGTDWTTVQQKWSSGNYGAFYGESLIAQDVFLDAFDQPLNSVFGRSAPSQVPGFTLNEMLVPEPSVLALGLGATALLGFRRRLLC